MTRPSCIDLELFRSFKSQQHIELRPLTLLFGENNVGKSSLLRAIALLADSASGEAGASLAYDRSASARRQLPWPLLGPGTGVHPRPRLDDGFHVSWTFRHETYAIDAQTSTQRVFVSVRRRHGHREAVSHARGHRQ